MKPRRQPGGGARVWAGCTAPPRAPQVAALAASSPPWSGLGARGGHPSSPPSRAPMFVVFPWLCDGESVTIPAVPQLFCPCSGLGAIVRGAGLTRGAPAGLRWPSGVIASVPQRRKLRPGLPPAWKGFLVLVERPGRGPRCAGSPVPVRQLGRGPSAAGICSRVLAQRRTLRPLVARSSLQLTWVPGLSSAQDRVWWDIR